MYADEERAQLTLSRRPTADDDLLTATAFRLRPRI